MGVIVTRNVSTGSDSVSGAFTQDEKSNIEFKMEFKAAFLLYYKELTKNPQKQLINVGVWSDNLKTLKLFNKDLTYNVGKQLIQTVLTRISDGLFLNSVFAYNAKKQLISVTRSGTVCSSSSSSTSSSSSSSSSSLSSSSSSTSSSSSSSSTSSSSSSSSTSSSSSSSSTSSSSSSSSTSSSSSSTSSSSSSSSTSSSSSSTSSSSSSSSTSSSSTSSSSSSFSLTPLFPDVQSIRTSSEQDLGISHTVPLPAIVDAGNLIVVFFCAGGTSITTSWPNEGVDWIQIFEVNSSNTIHLSIAYKIADGTEGGTSIIVTTSSNRVSSSIAYSITDHNSSINPPEISTGDTGTSDSPNPDSVTASWGADDNLFIAIEAHNTDSSIVSYVTEFPDNRRTRAFIGGSERVCTCTREFNSTDTQDPSTFTIGSSQDWIAPTMVVQGGIEGSTSSSSSSSSVSSSYSSSSSCEFGSFTDWEIHFTNGVSGDWYETSDGIWDESNSKWDSTLAFPADQIVKMDQFSGGSAKAWTVGYRPDVVRLTIDDIVSTFDLTILSLFGTIISTNTYQSGDIANLTFPLDNPDIFQLEIIGSNSFSITNIEWGFHGCYSSSSSSVSSS